MTDDPNLPDRSDADIRYTFEMLDDGARVTAFGAKGHWVSTDGSFRQWLDEMDMPWSSGERGRRTVSVGPLTAKQAAMFKMRWL